MKRNEIINLADSVLKNVSKLKVDIKNTEDKGIRQKQINSINHIFRVISTLPYEEQRITCYIYFDKLTIKHTAIRLGLSYSTVKKRLEDQCLLKVGRMLFGFEDEFWNMIRISDDC